MSCSKRQLAYVFLGIGVFLMLVGVICGFLIPKIVIRIFEKAVCVDSDDDPDYEDWVKDSRTIVTKLYYWEITNKNDFLYNGKMPKLKEKGPYVYKQGYQRTNVSFKNNRRSYKLWMKEAAFSRADSCDDCLEDDKITLINSGYFAGMNRFSGDQNFAFILLPTTVQLLLDQFNQSYEELGNVNESVWQDLGNSGWSRPGFGAWLHAVDSSFGNFSEIEMRGLYDVLGNSSALFGETLSNTTVKSTCKKNPVNQNCGFLGHLNGANTSNTTLLRDTLCRNKSTSCFNDSSAIPFIFRYILHVSGYTMWFMLHEQDDVVTTISQKKLALGYEMLRVRDPTGQRVKVPGLVTVHATKEEAQEKADEESFYTCEASENKHHKWAAFNGNDTIPSSHFTLSPENKTVRGYSLLVPHSTTASSPCSFSQKLPMNSFEIFVSKLSMKFTVSYKKDTSLYGLNLKRYTLNKKDFLGHSAVQDGLIDFSFLYGFPVVISLPHFLFADNITIPPSFNQRSDEQEHESVYDVEPTTGIVANAQMRIQSNVPIMKELVSIPRPKAFNITYLSNGADELLRKGIPIWWATLGGQAEQSDTDQLKKKVLGVLGLSCGLLIALPIVGGIFVVVFIALLVLSHKANRITHIT